MVCCDGTSVGCAVFVGAEIMAAYSTRALSEYSEGLDGQRNNQRLPGLGCSAIANAICLEAATQIVSKNSVLERICVRILVILSLSCCIPTDWSTSVILMSICRLVSISTAGSALNEDITCMVMMLHE